MPQVAIEQKESKLFYCHSEKPVIRCEGCKQWFHGGNKKKIFFFFFSKINEKSIIFFYRLHKLFIKATLIWRHIWRIPLFSLYKGS
jgi:hypothetical protein